MKLLDLINELGIFAVYKINEHKSLVFRYTKNERPEMTQSNGTSTAEEYS